MYFLIFLFIYSNSYRSVDVEQRTNFYLIQSDSCRERMIDKVTADPWGLIVFRVRDSLDREGKMVTENSMLFDFFRKHKNLDFLPYREFIREVLKKDSVIDFDDYKALPSSFDVSLRNRDIESIAAKGKKYFYDYFLHKEYITYFYWPDVVAKFWEWNIGFDDHESVRVLFRCEYRN